VKIDLGNLLNQGQGIENKPTWYKYFKKPIANLTYLVLIWKYLVIAMWFNINFDEKLILYKYIQV
jgi:hypothetical protein